MASMTLDADLPRLFTYECWADREALTAIRAAGDNAPPRAVALLNHVLAAAHLWLTRITGEKIKIDVWPTLSLDEMAARIDMLDSTWQAWLVTASAADLEHEIRYVNSLGESWSSAVRDILTHLVIHAAYHRGQIAMLLGQSGNKPAYTDFIHATRQGVV